MSLLATALPNLLVALDESLGDDFSQPARLLRFETDDDGVLFGIKELPAGQHPLDDLMGFVAPDEWAALGTACHGWASRDFTARPSRAADRVRVRSIFVVARDGTELGGLRLSGGELRLEELVIGNVPDALRRCLGLPTPPPDMPAAELTAADWLDAIADDARATAAPPTPAASWDEVRWEVITGARVVKGLSPTIATWMDEGMFARSMSATYPRTTDQLAAVRRVVDKPTFSQIRRTLRRWKVND